MAQRTLPGRPPQSSIVPYANLSYISGPTVLSNDRRPEVSRTRTDSVLSSCPFRGSWQSPRGATGAPDLCEHWMCKFGWLTSGLQCCPVARMPGYGSGSSIYMHMKVSEITTSSLSSSPVYGNWHTLHPILRVNGMVAKAMHGQQFP